MEKKVLCEVYDLGASAFVMMHGFKVIGRKGTCIFFEVDKDAVDQFEALQIEYLTSEFHRFDSCLMALKKMKEYLPK